jgi:ketosteroid isomerase-like protein
VPPPNASNVEVVRRTFDAIFRRDIQRAATGFHHDAVWHNTREFPGPSTCVGPRAIAEFWGTLMESFDGETRVEQIIDGEEGVALGAHTIGRGTTSGVPLDLRWGIAARVVGGKISRVDVYGEWAKALRAVGLDE